MTVGQRIAQKRKELGLSQEGLGEQLGVSRQAIYKWESDASLPEIDKLITLSKIFSVSVGWLLGVEEDEGPSLSQDQEKLVEEVLSRYQPPAPQKSAWDKWSVRILFALCGIMLALLVAANRKIKEMDQRYTDLAISIGEVSYSVNSQVGSITNQVENILKSQNNLMAEWSAELASTDLAANTATFAVRVVPKTYVEGMTALFVARSGEDTVELSVEPGADHAFAGQITCPLSDQIDVSAVLITGDKRETQWLDDFYDLYSNTFPDLFVSNTLWFDEKDGVLSHQMSTERDIRRGSRVLDHSDQYHRQLGWYPEPPAKLQVGLFQDQKLLLWYQGGMETTSWSGRLLEELIWRRPQDITLEPGHQYCEAAIYTDEYGRQRVYPGDGLAYDELKESWLPSTPYADGLTDWEF